MCHYPFFFTNSLSSGLLLNCDSDVFWPFFCSLLILLNKQTADTTESIRTYRKLSTSCCTIDTSKRCAVFPTRSFAFRKRNVQGRAPNPFQHFISRIHLLLYSHSKAGRFIHQSPWLYCMPCTPEVILSNTAGSSQARPQWIAVRGSINHMWRLPGTASVWGHMNQPLNTYSSFRWEAVAEMDPAVCFCS